MKKKMQETTATETLTGIDLHERIISIINLNIRLIQINVCLNFNIII
jgi:hypothetical protein